jgi:transcriptional regulator with XRE-family HTH domain
MVNESRKASDELLWRLSDNLKRLREARGYSQEDLARISGLNRSYIGNVEQAIVNITLANLERLAKGLDCTVADLLKRHPTR